MKTKPKQIRLRPAKDSDQGFLFEVYYKAEDTALDGIEEPLRSQLLEMQFRAQRQHYSVAFPDATDYVIDIGMDPEARPIGRIYLDEAEARIHIVDIAILPSQQGQGWGTEVVSSILDSAQAKEKVVTLRVNRLNSAIEFYRKLGFEIVGKDDFFYEMAFNHVTGEPVPTKMGFGHGN